MEWRMTDNLSLFIEDFKKVRDLGFIPSRRSSSTGIGKTFEDFIGVAENNITEPDLHGFEIKSQRNLSSSYVTLFTKSPTMPKGANSYLRESYGSQDIKYPDIVKEGWTVEETEKWAKEKGIVLKKEYQETNDYDEGTIIDQSRAKDSVITKGATFKITIAKKRVDTSSTDDKTNTDDKEETKTDVNTETKSE